MTDAELSPATSSAPPPDAPAPDGRAGILDPGARMLWPGRPGDARTRHGTGRGPAAGGTALAPAGGPAAAPIPAEGRVLPRAIQRGGRGG